MTSLSGLLPLADKGRCSANNLALFTFERIKAAQYDTASQRIRA
jgi:hypothetical protein